MIKKAAYDAVSSYKKGYKKHILEVSLYIPKILLTDFDTKKALKINNLTYDSSLVFVCEMNEFS
jgi:hypothetical protein